MRKISAPANKLGNNRLNVNRIDMANRTVPSGVVGWSTHAYDSGFVAPSEFSTPDIICHKGALPANSSATVAAGGNVTLHWSGWPLGHRGPVIDYLASCNGDCSTVNKTELDRFKIDSLGLLNGSMIPGQWATDIFMARNVRRNFRWIMVVQDS